MTAADEIQPRFAWIGRVAFAWVVAIVLARATMLVAIRDMDASPTAPASPGAAVAITLDWFALVPIPLLILRRLFDDRFTLRFTLVHALFAALALWTLSSVGWSGDKFAALLGAFDVVAAAAMFWTVSQLVRRWDQLRVVAGVVVAIMLANVAQNVIYSAIEYPDLKETWGQIRERVFAEHGWQAGDYPAQRFEQKVLAGEFLGFAASTNTMAAVCVAGALVALGAAMQRFDDKDDPGWAGLFALAAAASLYPLFGPAIGAAVKAGSLRAFVDATSKGGLAALAAGVVALAAWRLARRWFVEHRPFVFAAGCVGVALLICSAIGYGLTTGGLPTDSLNFRWRYWSGAWPVWLAHPLAGVGWANFGDAYLAHRLPPAAEEIGDPHNFLVRWATELGTVGLLIGVAWLGLFAWRAARPVRRATVAGEGRCRIVGVLLAVAAAFALSVACTIDFAAPGDAFSYALIEGLKRAVLFGVIALAVAGVALPLRRRGPRDEPPSFADTMVDSRPAPWLKAALFVAVGTLLLQSAIDLALFEPGPLAMVAMMMGAAIGIAGDDRPARGNARPLIALVVSGIALLVALVAIVVPINLAERAARAADAFAEKQPERALALYADASRFTPVANSAYAERAFRVAAASRDSSARAWLDRLVAADPSRAGGYLMRARFEAATGETEPALADFARALALDPKNVDARIEYADLLERAGKRREASDELFRALADDDALDEKEPKRLDLRKPGTRALLSARAARLQ